MYPGNLWRIYLVYPKLLLRNGLVWGSACHFPNSSDLKIRALRQLGGTKKLEADLTCAAVGRFWAQLWASFHPI